MLIKAMLKNNFAPLQTLQPINKAFTFVVKRHVSGLGLHS